MKRLRIALMVIMPLVMLAKIYYPDFAAKRSNENQKEQFQELLLGGGDNNASVSSVSIYENVISLKINIHNVLLTESKKNKFAQNSHRIFPKKVCSSVGLREWLERGKWISIDVIANSDKTVTNIRVTSENCT
ncbi:hypothetical protein [Vibrio parahaemolyticus]|uniref:hypothetical protein n=1 Tax=Vibrio parahaemolyticus TaxID=670 RepID=UPI0021529B74|nr:hypothetical protein [Vibrio parahaemolyticus]